MSPPRSAAANRCGSVGYAASARAFTSGVVWENIFSIRTGSGRQDVENAREDSSLVEIRTDEQRNGVGASGGEHVERVFGKDVVTHHGGKCPRSGFFVRAAARKFFAGSDQVLHRSGAQPRSRIGIRSLCDLEELACPTVRSALFPYAEAAGGL